MEERISIWSEIRFRQDRTNRPVSGHKVAPPRIPRMGLAESTGPNVWRVRRDFDQILRAMQRTNDRQSTGFTVRMRTPGAITRRVKQAEEPRVAENGFPARTRAPLYPRKPWTVRWIGSCIETGFRLWRRKGYGPSEDSRRLVEKEAVAGAHLVPLAGAFAIQKI